MSEKSSKHFLIKAKQSQQLFIFICLTLIRTRKIKFHLFKVSLNCTSSNLFSLIFIFLQLSGLWKCLAVVLLAFICCLQLILYMAFTVRNRFYFYGNSFICSSFCSDGKSSYIYCLKYGNAPFSKIELTLSSLSLLLLSFPQFLLLLIT